MLDRALPPLLIVREKTIRSSLVIIFGSDMNIWSDIVDMCMLRVIRPLYSVDLFIHFLYLVVVSCYADIP